MKERRLLGIGVLLAAALGLAGVLASKVLTWPSHELRTAVPTSHKLAASSTLVLPASQSPVPASVSELSAADGSQSNILELPKASIDFVGDWGGYTHSTIRSLAAGFLTGKNPGRVSVIFGRQGETVFIADELYSGP